MFMSYQQSRAPCPESFATMVGMLFITEVEPETRPLDVELYLPRFWRNRGCR